MKTIIFVLLLSVFLERSQARDVSWETSKNYVADDIDEDAEYEILLQKLGKNSDFLDGVKNSFSPRSDDHYGYTDDSQYPPSRWSEKWSTCGGIKQSPINVDPSTCKRDVVLYPLKMYNFNSHPKTTTVQNVGHSVQYSFTFNKKAPYVTRGVLNLKKYLFAQLHFHFGKTDDVGSEHTIGSNSYSLELHLVFYRSTYADVSDASQYSDGLLVIGILFQTSDDAHDQFFTEHLANVSESGDITTVKNARGTRLIDFVGSLNFKYVRYDGSLTTPPCSEAVKWYVSTTIREISRNDIEAFRALNGDEGPMGGNNRPTQEINDRKCYVS